MATRNLPNTAPEIIEARRERVAQLRLRGLTQRAIVEALAAEGVVNAETGQPWSVGTIAGDLKALQRDWKKRAAAHVDEHRAQQLAMLDEVIRAAWAGAPVPGVVEELLRVSADPAASEERRREAVKGLGSVAAGDLRAVLASLKQRAELLGLDAPTKSMSFDIDMSKLSDEQLTRIAAGEDPLRVWLAGQ